MVLVSLGRCFKSNMAHFQLFQILQLAQDCFKNLIVFTIFQCKFGGLCTFVNNLKNLLCSCFIHHGVIHLKCKFIHSSCIYPFVQILPFIILSSNIHPSFMHIFQSSMHLSLKFYSVNYHLSPICFFHP